MVIKILSVSILTNNFTFLSNFSNIMGTFSTIIFLLIIIINYLFEYFDLSNKKIYHLILVLTLLTTLSFHNIIFLIYILPSLFLNILDIILRNYFTINSIHGQIIHINNDRYNKTGVFIHITFMNKMIQKNGNY